MGLMITEKMQNTPWDVGNERYTDIFLCVPYPDPLPPSCAIHNLSLDSEDGADIQVYGDSGV